MKNKIGMVLVCCFVGAGCQSPERNPATHVDNWFRAQDRLAKVLNKRNGGSAFRIAAITGAIYPIGTTFEGVRPENGCQFTKEAIKEVDLPPWPEVVQSRTFQIDASIPSQWAGAIGLAQAGAGARSQQTFHMRYTSLRQQFVYDGDLKEMLNNPECLRSLGDFLNHPKTLLRGYYSGALEISNTNNFQIGSDFQMASTNGLSVKFDTMGGMLIQQTQPIAWFGIYTDLRASRTRENEPIKDNSIRVKIANADVGIVIPGINKRSGEVPLDSTYYFEVVFRKTKASRAAAIANGSN